MALANRTPTAGLLHHSDRGSQYAATSYQRLLDAHGITTSMSRQGNCWDNACVESFFGTLKRELVYHRHYTTREDARQDIFEYIDLPLILWTPSRHNQRREVPHGPAATKFHAGV